MNCPLCDKELVLEVKYGHNLYHCPVNSMNVELVSPDWSFIEPMDHLVSHYCFNESLHRHRMMIFPYKIVTYSNPNFSRYSTISKYYKELKNFRSVYDEDIYIEPTSESKLLSRIKTILVFS